jgi:hypothetical protein
MVGQPDVTDLAGRHQLRHRADRLLDRQRTIGIMELEHVDVVRAQPDEAGLEVGLDSGRSTVLGPRAVALPDGAALGQDRHLGPADADGPANELLCPAPPVERCGVDPGDAAVEGGVDRGDGGGLVLGPPPERALLPGSERCRPEADRAAELHDRHRGAAS